MKDRTSIGIATFFNGKFNAQVRDVLYADYDKYESLPEACKCPEIKAEFKAYKDWEKSLKVLEKLEKQIVRWGR
ncbi:MAG TPA: hypothetical protein VMW10_05970 [Alphaproteobacteria bacterium]|nr:hypothetical protein [Alphaproteobacteria bacterium]